MRGGLYNFSRIGGPWIQAFRVRFQVQVGKMFSYLHFSRDLFDFNEDVIANQVRPLKVYQHSFVPDFQ